MHWEGTGPEGQKSPPKHLAGPLISSSYQWAHSPACLNSFNPSAPPPSSSPPRKWPGLWGTAVHFLPTATVQACLAKGMGFGAGHLADCNSASLMCDFYNCPMPQFLRLSSGKNNYASFVASLLCPPVSTLWPSDPGLCCWFLCRYSAAYPPSTNIFSFSSCKLRVTAFPGTSASTLNLICEPHHSP